MIMATMAIAPDFLQGVIPMKPVCWMTRLVRFKHGGLPVGKMLKATIYIQRKNSSSADTDDKILFYEDSDYHEMVRIVYSSPEMRKDSSFYLTVPRAMGYLDDVLKTFRHDADPFEYVQVSTQIHPSVLYHVSELDCCQVRHLIVDTVEAAIERPVQRTKKH
jgi:hypothetical protein